MEKIINSQEFVEWDKLYRINLLNKLSGFKSACLVGTCDVQKQSNLAIFNSLSHIGSNPFYLGIIFRPTNVERHTYENIKARNFYTINLINEFVYEKAHKTSAKYSRNVSEFGACNLHEQYIEDFKAPFVKECTVKLGLSFAEEQLFRCNNTRMIIGKVEKIILPEHSVDDEGNIRLDHQDIVTVNGLDTYYKSYFLQTMAFARP